MYGQDHQFVAVVSLIAFAILIVYGIAEHIQERRDNDRR